MKSESLSNRTRSLRFETLAPRRVLAALVLDPSDGESLGQGLARLIRQANATAEPDTIMISAPVVDLSNFALSEAIEITSEIRIQGQASDKTKLIGSNETRLFDVASDGTLHLSGLMIDGGRAPQGGAIRNAGDLSIDDVAFIGGQSQQGGAIYNSGYLSVRDSLFAQSNAVQGGAIFNQGQLVVDGGVFVGNRASGGYGGGGLFNSGTTNLVDAHFSDNASIVFGGAISSIGSMSSDRLTVIHNEAPMGAGISVANSDWNHTSSTFVAENGDSDSGNVAQIQKGTPAALLSPLIYSLPDGVRQESPMATRWAWFQASTDSEPHSLPTLLARATSWQKIKGQPSVAQGSEIPWEGYNGYSVQWSVSDLTDEATEQFAWRSTTLNDVQSSAGSRVELITTEIAGVNTTTLSYQPREGFVGTDKLSIQATTPSGQPLHGEINVTVDDQVHATLVTEAIQRGENEIRVDIMIPDNHDTKQTQLFRLAVSFDDTVVRLTENSRIGPGFDAQRILDIVSLGSSQSMVSLLGLSSKEPSDVLATLNFERIGPGDANIQIDPALQWQLESEGAPLSPQAVNLVYNTYNVEDVNRDGKLSPVDALIVLNSIGTAQATGPKARNDMDTNGDGIVSPIDALLVLNRLQISAGSSEALSPNTIFHQSEDKDTDQDAVFATEPEQLDFKP